MTAPSVSAPLEIRLPPLHDGQRTVFESKARFKVVCCGRRWGKALALDTRVPTPQGWTTMGALHDGDELFGADGQIVRVKYAHEVRYDRPCYRVEFSDGTSIIADEEHLWKVRDKHGEHVRTTREIARLKTVQMIDASGALQYPTQDLPVDPYVLGIWLGDGDSARAALTTEDEFILSEISRRGCYPIPFGPNGNQYYMDHRNYGGVLNADLRSLGVLNNKHVPVEYLHGDIEQRTALLQGLMDSDGSVETNGRCEVTFKNELLADAVLELARSLGQRPVKSVRTAYCNGSDCGPVYRIRWTSSIQCFLLPRKAERLVARCVLNLARSITAVVPVDSVPVRCITVDAKDSLYLAGEAAVVTHNTHLGVLMCIIVGAKGGRAWWIGPSYPVAAIGWRLLREMVSPIPGIDIREGDKMIIFPNGGMVQIKSADRPDSLRGESLDFVVFDEVADIKEDAWYEGIRPALASGRDYFNDQVAGGGALFIGTPRGQGNWFYDIFLRAETEEARKKGWEAFQQPTINNTMIPGLVDEVEAARADMHPTKASQEFDAVFIVGGGVVFHDGWQRWYQMVGDQRVYTSESSVVLIDQDHIYETCSLSKCIRFGTSDLAITTKTSADYTVVAAWALTPLKNLLLLDFTRARMEGPDIVPSLHQMRQRWRLAYMGIEKVAFQASIVQEARRKGMPVKELKPDKDKTARAYNAAAYMQGGKIWWRKTIPEMLTFSTEVMNFPLAPHDDCTDTLSYATAGMDRISTGPQLLSW